MFQYDSTTYSRNRDSARTSASTDRPTTVTAKYINPTPSYKSSSIPVLCNDRSAREETPISTVASRYSSYNKADKTTKYDKKDYNNKLLVPTSTTNKSRDVSPVSLTAKYGLSRTSRHISPDRRTKSFKDKKRDGSPDRDKDIPSKTDKSAGYSSLSSYKLYPRSTSYTRPTTRTEIKPEVTVNRYAIASRLSTNYLKTPTPVKRSSVSPVNFNDNGKTENTKQNSDVKVKNESKSENEISAPQNENDSGNMNDNEVETINVVTRHTSPTPPGSSAYVRSRRAELAKTIEKTINRLKKRPEMINKEIQSDRLDDSTRTSRFGSTSRTSLTNWSYYSPNSHNYTGYAGRYSTQYSNLRENSSLHNISDRNSCNTSTEPLSIANAGSALQVDNITDGRNGTVNNTITNTNTNTSDVYDTREDDNTSEIIINVNLKLKKSKSPSAELLSPEITITNSQLPPQAPKSDGINKTKKVKSRKSSTDSQSDTSSKKKIVKKRSKSVSSTDSDQCNDNSTRSKDLRSKSPSKIAHGSGIHLNNNSTKLAHSKSRESNSPETSITLSTQSSMSEEENNQKFQDNNFSLLTTEDDRTTKQTSPLRSVKNEGGTEEAKSFLIRALAPVTNLFKLRHQETCESSKRLDNVNTELNQKDITHFTMDNDISVKNRNNTDNIVASNNDNLVTLKSIRPIESGDNGWWLPSNIDTKDIKHNGEKAILFDSNIDVKNDHTIHQINKTDSVESMKPMKKYTMCDDEKPWWLDSSANIPEGVERLTPPRKASSDSDKSEKNNFCKIGRVESDEQKDWRSINNDSSIRVNKSESSSCLSRSNSDIKNFPLRRIRHIESGERPWWLSSDKNIPEGIEKLPTPPPQQDSESSDSEEVHIYMPASQLPPFPLHLPEDEPLGDRRSPEGLETPKENENYGGRSSPYENERHFRRSTGHVSYQKGAEKYISRYTDIDDILGTSGQVYSPFIDSILARRTGQMPFDDDDCEEIDPTQVRIHDSTPQRPVIKKLRSRYSKIFAILRVNFVYQLISPT